MLDNGIQCTELLCLSIQVTKLMQRSDGGQTVEQQSERQKERLRRREENDDSQRCMRSRYIEADARPRRQ